MITSNYVIIEVTYINSFKYLSNFLVMSEKKKSMYSASVHVKDFRIQQSILSGWKRGFVISFMIGTFVITLYPILVDPLLHEDKYKKIHEEVQAEVYQAGLLPGQLRKWENPWKQ